MSDWTEILALSQHHQLPALELGGYEPDLEAVNLLSEDLARKHHILPLFRLKSELYVATPDPDNLIALDYLAQLSGCSIEPVVVLKSDLEAAFNRLYLTRARATETISRLSGPTQERPAGHEAALIEDSTAPAVRLVEHILSQGVRLDASDVHLEPYAGRLELRYRIDGALRAFPPPPPEMGPAVIARLKIQSGLDIAERRLPQDGRSSVRVDGLDYDLRVSVIPNIHGEGVVVRILNPIAMNKELNDLGFPVAMLEQYERIVGRPWGILLVTGPTGSGKTTTLYATLKRLLSPEKKVITLEDPVEFKMDGITQIQVRSQIGYTFAQGLRSVLRHDPDILMVGEIRDLESADIAVKAALTGHFLFSTLHTNDSTQTLGRLLDMGLEHYQVQAALSGVLAQRLVRRLCASCKVPRKLEPAERAVLGLPEVDSEHPVYGPRGCTECNQVGYRGRVAVYELLEITRPMRRLPREQLVPEGLIGLAREAGFVTLRESAVQKMLEGVTSFEEVVRLTAEE